MHIQTGKKRGRDTRAVEGVEKATPTLGLSRVTGFRCAPTKSRLCDAPTQKPTPPFLGAETGETEEEEEKEERSLPKSRHFPPLSEIFFTPIPFSRPTHTYYQISPLSLSFFLCTITPPPASLVCPHRETHHHHHHHHSPRQTRKISPFLSFCVFY